MLIAKNLEYERQAWTAVAEREHERRAQRVRYGEHERESNRDGEHVWQRRPAVMWVTIMSNGDDESDCDTLGSSCFLGFRFCAFFSQFIYFHFQRQSGHFENIKIIMKIILSI